MTVLHIILAILVFNAGFLLVLGFVALGLRRDIRRVFDKLQAFRQASGISAVVDEQDEQQELQRTQEILDKAAARQGAGQSERVILHTDNLGEDEVIMDDDRPIKR